MRYERFVLILLLRCSKNWNKLVLGRKILKLLILNDNSSISQDEDWFDAVFRWPKSAKNGIFMSFSKIFVSKKQVNTIKYHAKSFINYIKMIN